MNRRSWWLSFRRRLRAAREIYEGVYIAPYRSAIHREYLRQRDLFLLLGFSDLLGVPNPVQFYTLELYPELIEQFHEVDDSYFQLVVRASKQLWWYDLAHGRSLLKLG